MKYGKTIVSIAVFSASLPSVTLAFETETHALITQAAYSRSVLNASGSVLNILGLDRLDNQLPFNRFWMNPGFPFYYVDGGKTGVSISGGSFSLATGSSDVPEGFERCEMLEFLGQSVPEGFFNLFKPIVSTSTVDDPALDSILPIPNWLVRGAIREDDMGPTRYLLAWSSACGLQWVKAQEIPFIGRSLNHFYDPFFDTAGTGGEKAVDWALGYSNSFANPPLPDTSRQNHYSYTDARNFEYAALTREFNLRAGQPYTASQRQADALDRMISWASLFRSLGDTVHLLEDMAQPQHSRNDPHAPYITTPAQQAFEPYTNARILGSGSVGAYVQAFFGSNNVPLSAPTLGNYPTPSFASPTRFFTTRGDSEDTGDPLSRLGIADYTNRGFFTGGTLPGDSLETYPPSPLSENSGYSTVSIDCPQTSQQPQLQSVHCTHYTLTVPDNIAPNYVDSLPIGFSSPQVPVLAEGIFRDVILSFGGVTINDSELEFMLSPTEFDAIGDMVIPRAIGYATGMINYFFRDVGGITITPPESGVYAILDHGRAHTMNSAGYPCIGSDASDGCQIFGFTAVQANIQNTMPSLVESGPAPKIIPQHMTSGTLVAVARFHRNTCYRSDLSGDLSFDMNTAAADPANVPAIYPSDCPNQTAWSQGRSGYPEIAVSAVIPVDADGNIQAGVSQESDVNGDSPTLVQFDFSGDPIPINATDLYLEVVFRGDLGDTSHNDANEYEINSVVVGSIDVSEPTYNIFVNLGNYYFDANSKTWMTIAEAQEQLNVQGIESTFTIPRINACVGNDALVTYGSGDTPSPGLAMNHAIRFAVIVDPHAPASGNQLLNSWVVPYDGYYDSGYITAGNPAFGEFGTIANGPPYYTAHLAQASLESNAEGDYLADALNAGVGAVWGDNFYFFYQTSINSAIRPQPLLPTTPLLTGSIGVFLPDQMSDSEVYLNLPLSNPCGSTTYAKRMTIPAARMNTSFRLQSGQ